MKILANDTAIFVPIAVPCVWRDRCVMVEYATHSTFVPSSGLIFVYKLETSIDTRIVSLPIFVFSKKLKKAVVYFI